MKKKYVSPRFEQRKLIPTTIIAASLENGGVGGNGDEGEVRQENLFNSDDPSSIWDNEW